jgi:WD40 repeat protein
MLKLWNSHTGEPKAVIRLRAQVSFLSFSPDGKKLLSGDAREDRVQIHEVPSGRLLTQTPAREGEVLYGEFSPDGERFVTASVDGSARVWSARTGGQLIDPMRHKGTVNWACFSQDGRWIATASEDFTAQVWDAKTGRPAGSPMRHRDIVQTVAFSADGETVLTASLDGTARLWDSHTGRPVAEPFQHQGKLWMASFSPDGRRILTAADPGEARLWDVPPMFTAPGSPDSAKAGLLLVDLADYVTGKRLTSQGALENASSSRLSETQKRLQTLPPDSDFTRWVVWFLADRSTRTISPYSQIDLPHYLSARAQAKNYLARREAVMLCPTNSLALRQLGEALLESTGSNSPVIRAEANLLIRRAESSGSGDENSQ